MAAGSDVSRRQIWDALASPYLDTDGMVFLEFAVDVLGRSGLSLRELRRIDRQEVAPALWSQGFYGDWIATDATLDRIQSFVARPAWRRYLRRLLTRPLTYWMSRHWWAVLTQRLHRDGPRSSG